MVTTATSMIRESTKVRPISYNVFLWCIPLLTWMLIPAAFLLSSQSDMVPLIQTGNSLLLNNVQTYLESKEVSFRVDGNAILILPSEKERILRELSKMEWWMPNLDHSLSRTESPSQASSNPVSHSEANKGS